MNYSEKQWSSKCIAINRGVDIIDECEIVNKNNKEVNKNIQRHHFISFLRESMQF